jgi:hypothetical protein
MMSDAIHYPIGIFGYIESHGVSDEANRVRDLFCETRERFWSSVSLGSSRKECLNQLLDVFSEAGAPGWDGSGAHPLGADAVNAAYLFINAIPSNVPMPEIGADPDGEVSLDWYAGPRRQFSISLGARNVLSFAGLFGSDKVSGSERFQGTIPRNLLDYIERVVR